MPKGQKVRVNLGSGSDYLPGWINVDIDPAQKIDIVADLQKSFPFADNSIDEIKASDILEHFTKEDGVIFLKECYRVLRVGGKLFLRTHNIHQIIKQFGNDSEIMIHFIYGNTEGNGGFGAHKFAYTEDSLRKALIKTNFHILSIEKETTNFVVNAVKQDKITNKKMHIAVIQQTPDIGGAETYMHSLIKQFLKKGDIVTLATNLDKFITLYNGYPIKIDRIPVILDFIGDGKGLLKSILFLQFAIIFYWKLAAAYKKMGVDVILMSGFSEKLLVSFLSVFFRLPVVWIEYGPLETIFRRNFTLPKMLYRLARGIPQSVIVPSRNTERDLMRHGRVSLAKLAVVPCGVIIPDLQNIKKETLFPSEKDVVIIGSVSRLTEEKGQQVLIRAVPHILKEAPNARFVIIGGGDQEYFKRMIDEQGFQDVVKLTGFVPSTDPYYRAMDIFVFPTVWELEGFGVAILEAMSYEIPIVASNIGPVTEVVEEGKVGFLFTPGSEKELAEAAISLVRDKEKRKQYGKAGRRLVEERYTIEQASDKIRNVLIDATL